MKKTRQTEPAEEPVGIVISQGNRNEVVPPPFVSSWVWGSEKEPISTGTLTAA